MIDQGDPESTDLMTMGHHSVDWSDVRTVLAEELEQLRADAARYRWLRDRDRHLHPNVDDVVWAETCARNIDAEIAREEIYRAMECARGR